MANRIEPALRRVFRHRCPPHNAHRSLPSDPESGGNDLVHTFFERSFAINRLRQGPLAGHIDLLAARLATHGYSRVHSRIQLRLVGHFNRWLEQKDLTVEQIDEELVERYWRYFMREKSRPFGVQTRTSRRVWI